MGLRRRRPVGVGGRERLGELPRAAGMRWAGRRVVLDVVVESPGCRGRAGPSRAGDGAAGGRGPGAGLVGPASPGVGLTGHCAVRPGRPAPKGSGGSRAGGRVAARGGGDAVGRASSCSRVAVESPGCRRESRPLSRRRSRRGGRPRAPEPVSSAPSHRGGAYRALRGSPWKTCARCQSTKSRFGRKSFSCGGRSGRPRASTSWRKTSP